ncbi:tRNA (adenosine(37)-N6)-threonylcarbamoyltransferase complex ATPase subunit type 1 TsaE [Paracoccus sp. M683]|uniref:tRNA (adenosine(37)-N6)-threonylcarbamoyltransferase complex ATPase subunit type 1 TsaE n=1 Tax=Paracoccus sp. M683 TaxID=2594268 RepID=UPI0011813A71|nr:tRNA (adenosine(37)-N6)-threonylcarbamoyltransferase complex ATPase subunit type 1 TsaE [Paracoccus sp. M683]TRW98844.1 tRNA (adenosine(37)-N6)-threonylcarbamoyltransferase complex ATPase subunit type 1 TsaE [Paracoccus sp. M683]
MQTLATLTADEAMTAALARMLAASARPGQTFLLDGPVGAGKTHFARAFIQARQGDAAEDVPSPTFTLVQTYDDPMGTEIWHADLYRLGDVSELDELGLDEALTDAITLIEWPERIEATPPGALWLRLAPDADPGMRQISLHGAPEDWPDLARAVERAQFIHAAGWGEAQVRLLAGDASARRYFRLIHGGDSAVLMDDPPPGSMASYLAMTGWLRDRGFAAPEVFAADPAHGLLLMDDLGDDLVARVLEREPALARPIYQRITDFLVDLHRHQPPLGILALDGPELARQVGMFAEWYPQAVGVDPAPSLAIAAQIEALHARLCADLPPVLSLRDFHAENLIWRGEAVLGLLDFQDAVATHPAYDLVSALQDARRDVDPAIEAAMIDRYIAATGLDADRFRAAYALLGAQRNLRIMGIFTRLALHVGKPRYLAFMPRVWSYVQRNLAHPALAPLAVIVNDLPAPTPDITDRIAARCQTPAR